MDDDDNKPTPDDALEPADTGMFHPESDEEKLPQDYNPPAADPDDLTSKPLPPDHPATDEVEETEKYQEGQTDAAIDNREEENPGQRPEPPEFK